MGVIPLDWDAVRAASQELTTRFAALIRSARDPQARVHGLDWTVAQLAAHVVSLTARYEPFLQGHGDGFYASMPEMNAKELDALCDLPLPELADRLESGTSLLLSLCPSGEAPARFFDLDSDCASAMALYVEELLLHGLDLAKTIDSPWPITHSDALIAIAGLIVPLPKFIDPEATRGFRATYELRLRGGPTVSMALDDGAATFFRGPSPNADCRISADPIAYLLTGSNRQSQWKALLRGKMFAFGRKPLLALRFKSMLISG